MHKSCSLQLADYENIIKITDPQWASYEILDLSRGLGRMNAGNCPTGTPFWANTLQPGHENDHMWQKGVHGKLIDSQVGGGANL
jgi:hypothetical protein